MKLGRVLTDEQYERRLNRLIARFEGEREAILQPFHARTLPRLKEVLAERGPLTAQEIGAVLGTKFGPQRVERWEELGWLVKHDRVPKQWKSGFGVTTHHIWRYVFSTPNREQSIEKLMERFLAKVESLDFQRSRLHCMANTLLPAAVDDRRKRAVELRVSGLTLEAVGQKMGLTRERARQLIETSNRRTGSGSARRRLLECTPSNLANVMREIL